MAQRIAGVHVETLAVQHRRGPAHRLVLHACELLVPDQVVPIRQGRLDVSILPLEAAPEVAHMRVGIMSRCHLLRLRGRLGPHPLSGVLALDVVDHGLVLLLQNAPVVRNLDQRLLGLNGGLCRAHGILLGRHRRLLCKEQGQEAAPSRMWRVGGRRAPDEPAEERADRAEPAPGGGWRRHGRRLHRHCGLRGLLRRRRNVSCWLRMCSLRRSGGFGYRQRDHRLGHRLRPRLRGRLVLRRRRHLRVQCDEAAQRQLAHGTLRDPRVVGHLRPHRRRLPFRGE
mmetsp:Transcript_103343/g.267288  ORF Transcript_103343/g.267288 Transcript_103343/m.267288 type:complete len:283 (+) Transcript_103343:287-1135(+)